MRHKIQMSAQNLVTIVLNDYILNHTSQKPYKCTFCEKSFAQACNLKRHKISSHSKNFPHKCSVCSKHDNLL